MPEEPRDRRDLDRPYLQLGKFLAAARRDADLSRGQVIERLQRTKPVSYPMLANVESGRRRLSDDLLVHLAPILGLTEDALRVVRNETDEAVARVSENVGQRDTARRLHEARSRLARRKSALATRDPSVERLYDQILQQSQELEVLSRAVAGPGPQDFDSRSNHIAALLGDLRVLDEAGLDHVHSFVKGLLAAQGRQETAVDPLASVPLIRVPGTPFGPLKTWTLADWMLALPGTEQAMSRARELADQYPIFEDRAHEPRSIGRRIAEHMLAVAAETELQVEYSWPSMHALAAAAEAGIHLRPKGRIERGQVSTYDWISFVSYQVNLDGRSVDSVLALWMTQMVYIAGVTRGPSTHAVDSFIEQCLPYARELNVRSLSAAEVS